MSIAPGTLLHDRYEIQADVDANLPERGFRALDLRLGRTVYVRVCPLPAPSDVEAFSGFDQRTHALAALQHPNLQLFFDVGMLRTEVFTVSEWLEGPSLADLIKKKPLPWVEARPLLRQVLEGLLYAHARGIHHLRLSSRANVIEPDGKLIVHDFSLIPDLHGSGEMADVRAFAALALDVVDPRELSDHVRTLLKGNPSSLRDLQAAFLENTRPPPFFSPKRWLGATAGLLLAGALGWGLYRILTPLPSSLAIRPFTGVGIGDPAIVNQLPEQIRLHLLRHRGLRLLPSGFPADLELEGRLAREGPTLLLTLVLWKRGAAEPQWTQTQPTTAHGVGLLEQELGHQLAEVMGQVQKPLPPLGPHTETESPEAFQAFVRAKFFMGSRTREGLRKAEDELESSLRLDPRFARAHAVLAECLILQGVHGVLNSQAAAPRARASAERALALDPGQAEAQCSLAYVRFRFDWDWKGAEDAFKKAVAQDPENPLIRHWYGFFLSCLGRWEDSIRELKAAVDLDPLAFQAHTNLAVAYSWSGQLEQGLEAFKKVLDLQPEFLSARDRVISELESKGRIVDSLAARDARSVYDPASRPAIEELKRVFDQGGPKAYWQARLDSHRLLVAKGLGDPLFLAYPMGVLGDGTGAFAALNQAIDNRSPMVVWIPRDPGLAPLRKDPRFKDLLRRINFPEK